jgi:hypothetical protein
MDETSGFARSPRPRSQFFVKSEDPNPVAKHPIEMLASPKEGPKLWQKTSSAVSLAGTEVRAAGARRYPCGLCSQGDQKPEGHHTSQASFVPRCWAPVFWSMLWDITMMHAIPEMVAGVHTCSHNGIATQDWRQIVDAWPLRIRAAQARKSQSLHCKVVG